jgi:hypothetical protein
LYLRRPTGEDKLRISSSQSAPPWLFTASKLPAAVLLLLELLASAPSDYFLENAPRQKRHSLRWVLFFTLLTF